MPAGALWDRLVGRVPAAASGPALPPLPQGDGPLIWLRLGRDQVRDGGAPGQLVATLRTARPGLRLIVTHPQAAPAAADRGADSPPRTVPGTLGPTVADPSGTPEGLRAFLGHVRPAVVLLLGSDLPETLLAETDRLRVPVVVADAELGRDEGARRSWPWQRARTHHLLGRAERVMVPDGSAREAALRLGAPSERIEVTGPLSDTRRPLGCAEAERASLAAVLAGRQCWFATSVPPAEDEAVIEAHRALLGHSHRALLVLGPDDPRRSPELVQKVEDRGLMAALRSATDEPEPGLQVMIADDPGELGLWYRLAQVTYFGGTLRPSAEVPRHPFEAAALGSAILHGPFTGGASAQGWTELRAASATREVRRADELGAALDELIAPDRAADCAARAWAVSTAGAAVAQRIAAAVLALLGGPGPRPPQTDRQTYLTSR